MAERLLTAHTTNATGATVRVPSWVKSITIDVEGTFDTATVTATVTAPGMTGTDQDDTWTAVGSKKIDRSGPYDIDLTVSSVGGSTDLDAVVEFDK